MWKIVSQKGVSLVSALLLMIIVSMAIALIGYLTVSSIQVKGTLKTYKTTKEAAESAVYTIISELNSKTKNGKCIIDENATCDNSYCENNCSILKKNTCKNLCKSLTNSKMSLNAKISSIEGLYIIKATVSAKAGTKTNIYVVYSQ